MLEAFTADSALWKLAKVPELPILADLDWIQRKHPNEFASPEAVAAHIRFVLDSETLITFKGRAKHSLGFARLEDRRGAVVQLVAKVLNGKRVYQVLTAYTLTPGQVRRALEREGDAPGVDPVSSGHSSEDVGPGFQGQPSGLASHREMDSTPTTPPRKVNPSAAEKRRQALRGVEASGSLEGVAKVMARRFQAKGYVKDEGGRWTLTKMGRAVMEGRIGAAGRGAVDMGGARHKAERAGGRRRAKGADLAAYMAGDGEASQKRQRKQEREYYEQEGDRLKAEWEARGAKLAREQAAEDRARAAVLGPSGRTHAVKIALEDRPFRRADLEALQTAGWILRPAGTVPAKVGRSMPAEAAWNPADALTRILGPKGETRAVVIQAESAFGEDLVRQLQTAGYDVSPAPKGYRQGHARALNPEPSAALKRAVYEALKRSTPKGGATAEDLARKVKAPVEEVEAALERHEANGLAHRRRDVQSLFGAVWEAGMDAPGFFSGAEAQQPLPMFNPRNTGQSGTVRDTRPRAPGHDGPMSTTTTGRKKAAATSKGHPTVPPVPAAPQRAKKPARPALVPKKIKKATSVPKFNPSDAEGLAKVWKAWTGAEPGQSMRLQVEEPHRYGLPLHVVLLGRVAWLATKAGKEIRFGVSGPYMVTDAQAQKLWLVSHRDHHFDLEPALIGYTARKPKFGDQATVEYVHAFEGRTRAVMDGQVGSLTGSFRITPAGLEG
jgi:hypothetical protein